jgi:hypothetical protein
MITQFPNEPHFYQDNGIMYQFLYTFIFPILISGSCVSLKNFILRFLITNCKLRRFETVIFF